MLKSGDAEKVAALMRETAAAELLPRFRNLADHEIQQKRPGDFVTAADVASEQRLATGLAKILPGVPVVGEEAVEADPGLVALIGRPGEACWIVDPLDGTANFAAGRDRFAMIVCLVRDAETIGGWILDVPNNRMAVAQKGQGVSLDGLRIEPREHTGSPRGLVGYRIRKEFERQLADSQRRRLGELTTLNCAGREYIEILSGHYDFCLYRMTKPWDHAAGALMLTEAGGGAERFDGRSFKPDDRIDAGIVASPVPKVLSEVKSILAAVQLPLLSQRL